MIQSELTWRQARANACDKDTAEFDLTSHWLRKWREFFKSIAQRSKARPKKTQMTYDAGLKHAAKYRNCTDERFEGKHGFGGGGGVILAGS